MRHRDIKAISIDEEKKAYIFLVEDDKNAFWLGRKNEVCNKK
jgi:hypothetical protein